LLTIIIVGILLLVAVAALFLKKPIITAGATLVAVVALIFGATYSLDQGEAAAVRNPLDGNIKDVVSPGIKFKAPWETVHKYDIRDNVIEFAGNAESKVSGADIRNAQITVTDSEGVASNMDVTISYSIDGTIVDDIYREYGAQDAFVQRVILNTTRSTVREIPGDYNTMALLTDREALAADIHEALEAKLADRGVIVEAVNLQEIRPPEAVMTRFAEAQEARIQVEKAEAAQATATVDAETKKIEAQGVADSNRILAESLSPEVLQQKYIDALSKSETVYVVPEGSQPMVGVPATK
jgi:regulator of protease activity HflC (stomatin/prohibitin superfamily)